MMDSVDAMRSTVQLPDGAPPFIHIFQNDFPGRKQKRLKDDDIAICECKYSGNDPESACGDRCLNVLTNTECVPGYCPCGDRCKNQRFQKSEYAKTKLFLTDGRGWGLLADEDIKGGQFIIEYCGEVIALEEAKQRSESYHEHGLKDAYIISLNANYFIDATKKGSMARFINHSCMPNCETRKWTVLGETRVGIFAKQDISAGTELSYNYNFEWYGGATVRCLCGAANCSIFLGAKSQCFQEVNHVWEEGDDRYTVEEIPLYDSAEDELPLTSDMISETSDPLLSKRISGIKIDQPHKMGSGERSGEHLQSFGTNVSYGVVPMANVASISENLEVMDDIESHKKDTQLTFMQNTVTISRVRTNSRNYMGRGQTSKKKPGSRGRQKAKQVNMENVANLFPTKEAREEVRRYQELKNEATANLNAVYDEIRPTIEARESDQQDTVPISAAEKWISAHCGKLRADLNFSFSIIENALGVKKPGDETQSSGAGDSK